MSISSAKNGSVSLVVRYVAEFEHSRLSQQQTLDKMNLNSELKLTRTTVLAWRKCFGALDEKTRASFLTEYGGDSYAQARLKVSPHSVCFSTQLSVEGVGSAGGQVYLSAFVRIVILNVLLM